jgi:hypothetical protein
LPTLRNPGINVTPLESFTDSLAASRRVEAR